MPYILLLVKSTLGIAPSQVLFLLAGIKVFPEAENCLQVQRVRCDCPSELALSLARVSFGDGLLCYRL